MGDGPQEGALARTGRALQQHVAVGRERGHHQFHLADPADDAAEHPLDQAGEFGHQ